MARKFSSVAVATTLVNAIGALDTSATVASATGFPAVPFTLVLDHGNGNEEIITVTARSGTSLTAITRGQDGTTAASHASNASVRHMVTGRDLQEPHDHIDATVAHGVTGAVVGTTSTQTLTNKTIDSASNTLTVAQTSVTGLTTALAAKAPLASPGLTGTPTAPTAAADTNTTQVATTAFVVGQAGSATPVVNGTAAVGTSLRYARQDHVHGTDTSRAPLASPGLTGTPTAPTAAAGTNNTQIATTAYVDTGLGTKAATVHTHAISDVNFLQAALDLKMAEPVGAGDGFITYVDSTDSTIARTITAGSNITVTNGNGINGNPIIGLEKAIYYGTTSVTLVSGASTSVPVTHGAGGTPTYVFLSGDNGVVNLSWGALTSTQFYVTGTRIDGVASTTAVNVHWMAVR